MEGILFLSPSLSSWKLGVLKLELVEPKFIPQHLATTPEDSCLAQPPVFHNISFLSASYSSVTRCHKHFSRGCIKLSKITSAFRAIATTPKIEASSRHLNPISAIISFLLRSPFYIRVSSLIRVSLFPTKPWITKSRATLFSWVRSMMKIMEDITSGWLNQRKISPISSPLSMLLWFFLCEKELFKKKNQKIILGFSKRKKGEE